MSNYLKEDSTAEPTCTEIRHTFDYTSFQGLTAAGTYGRDRTETLGHTGFGVYKGLRRAPGLLENATLTTRPGIIGYIGAGWYFLLVIPSSKSSITHRGRPQKQPHSPIRFDRSNMRTT